ncbi:DDE-type integrase/transposase/recombinase [Bordetella sp. 2513F-2]
MMLTLQDDRLTSLESLEAFVAGTAGLAPQASGSEAERHAHVQDVLQRFRYAKLSRRHKGVVLRYLLHTSGYSRQHLTRLVGRFVSHAPLGQRKSPAQGFRRRYTEDDARLLAYTDAVHDTLSGAATCHLLRRAWLVYGDAHYRCLATLSVSHLYNLRKSRAYRNARGHWDGTRPSKAVSIGLRQPPRPEGRAGFIRIDSVHQGEVDGAKGVYYINAVDCVTQWQVLACCQRISEAFLLPVLEELLAGFPFQILGVHADNGSEYINHRVAELLHKLNVEFTKSRPRHSNDNALVESKNGSVVRKTFGYAHIPQKHAQAVNAFCQQHLNPYLNFHRPCLFGRQRSDNRGKIKIDYPAKLVKTPLEKLLSLAPELRNLKDGISEQDLLWQARVMSDNQAAEQLQKHRSALFDSIIRRRAELAA